ncbi:MAG: hypothetical protein GIX03_03065 [Candidatus Eremiobacteraeota bacterium]|nr:hypothetical protein [Candidatus Eremiobacteraeota bacterium]MBC5801993.1 hypothetical protein [Candidatus Eremiobacteraeota bacterium]MBC5821289.1 hypothetical protein [Candidatus Eremiobacteraeota bacterium]
MSARFVASAAAALFLVTAPGVFAQQAPPSPGPTPLMSATPTAVATPVPSPTPVNLPSLPPTTHVDPYTRAAIDLLTGVVNRAISNIGNTTSGRVTYFKRFELQVQTNAGSYRSIHLHQGTIIDPRGATLTVGQHVDVSGVAQADGSLNANVITVH